MIFENINTNYSVELWLFDQMNKARQANNLNWDEVTILVIRALGLENVISVLNEYSDFEVSRKRS